MSSVFVPLTEIPFATAEAPLSVNENYNDEPFYFDFSNEGGTSKIIINSTAFASANSQRNTVYLSNILNQGVINVPAGFSYLDNNINRMMLKEGMGRNESSLKGKLSTIGELVSDDYGVDDLDVNGSKPLSRSNEHNNITYHQNALMTQIPFGLQTASPDAFAINEFVTSVNVLPSEFANTRMRNVYGAISHDREINRSVLAQNTRSNPLER